MEKMLTEICEYLNNYFWRTKIAGEFHISDGTLVVPTLKEGQYFRVWGSDLNDGVYIYPPEKMKDETFKGEVWSMAVPPAVIGLAADIAAWVELYGTASSSALSPFSSENFGNYGYSKGSSGSGSGIANGNTWQGVFAARLAPYRRLRGI